MEKPKPDESKKESQWVTGTKGAEGSPKARTYSGKGQSQGGEMSSDSRSRPTERSGLLLRAGPSLARAYTCKGPFSQPVSKGGGLGCPGAMS